MRSYLPSDLPAHRSFFTEFDRSGRLVGVPGEAVDVNLLRRLKLLLLTKSHVVIAASQLLESEEAHRLLLAYPELISSGAIISSMKARHPSIIQFLEEKRDTEGDERPGFLRPTALAVAEIIDSEGSAVRWKLEDMSDWFRDRLVSDLLDDAGLLHAVAERQGATIPREAARAIADQEGLSRSMVDGIFASAGGGRARFLVRTYADFLYYLSGARTTDSLGVLPQENFLDFTFSELLGRRAGMSEEEVFFKIFIDTVKAKTETVFPGEFLDVLSVSNALELREIALQRGFIEGYNSIQEKTKEAIDVRDPERLVLLLRELNELEGQMHASFSLALDQELTSKAREARQRAAGRSLKTLTSLVFPKLFEPLAYKELCVSTLEWMGHTKAVDSIDQRVRHGYAALETALKRSKLMERQPLLEFVSEMSWHYRKQML